MGLFGLFEEHVEKTANRMVKEMRQKLRSKSDQEIEYLYNNPLKTLPSISFAPLQLGARRSFVLSMSLPPEVANGMIVLPVKS